MNNGNVWTSKEGVFVSYDANTARLYFNDGSFWYMGGVGRHGIRCGSAISDADSGFQRESDRDWVSDGGEYAVSEFELADYDDCGCDGILY